MDSTYIDKILEQGKRIKFMEQTMGSTVNVPNKTSNSASRMLLYESQDNQKLNLYHPQVALLQTGLENQVAEFSSDFERTKHEYVVLAKICKFKSIADPRIQNHHYFLLVQDKETGMFDYIERIAYNHITESYGFLYNNSYIDKVKPGNIIPKGVAIKKSNSYDEFNNRMDGVNMNVTYMNNEETKEDSIIVSDYAAEMLAAPLIESCVFTINENELPLNLHGNTDTYKCFPDIGEEISNNLLAGIRLEKKDEILYAQSIERLKKIMMSDTRYTMGGQVVDINVYCNNPEFIKDNYNFQQIKYYYDQQQEFVRTFVEAIDMYVDKNNMSYKLQKLYYSLKQQLDGIPFLKEKPFSNVMIEIITVEKNPLKKGDKITNRYGGKGVVSEVRPRNLMPAFIQNGEKQYADIIYNSNTCFNRENPGQLFEVSENFIGQNITNEILGGKRTSKEIIDMYSRFLKIVAPSMYEAFMEQLKSDELNTSIQLIESIKKDGGIIISQKSISEIMTIDKLREVYREFPWIEQLKVIVPQENSNGQIRYIYARRRMVIAKQYFYRLKQYAKEKMSVTSLSTTNIRNENTRNTAKKYHRSNYSKTPTRFLAEMETHDLIHIGVEHVITALMTYSASPGARRLTEQLLTGDPFHIDIKLDDSCRNRSVEIVNCYLLTMGLELKFKKIPKKKQKLMERDYTQATRYMTRYEPGEKVKYMFRLKPDEKLKYMFRLPPKKSKEEKEEEVKKE